MAAPMDADVRGRVGAGRMLEWIDKSAYACAAAWSGHYCVTAYVGNVRFTRPVEVGHIVEVQSRVVHTGRTSMHIVATVSSGDPRQGELRVNTQCLLIFVAVDDDRKPTPVPTFTPQDEWERDQQERAVTLTDVRTRIEADMVKQSYTGRDGVVSRDAALPRGTDHRQLGRQRARRRRHGVDRRGGNPRRGALEPGFGGGRVRGRCALPPAVARPRPRRGAGVAHPHRRECARATRARAN